MAKRIRRRDGLYLWAVVGMVCLVWKIGPVLAQEAASKPELTAAQKERLKERDKFFERVQRLRAAGKLDEATTAAEAILAIERETLGPSSEDAIDSLEIIARLQEERDDWAAALKVRHEVLDLRVKALGTQHWLVVNTRFALERAQALAKLTPDQRRTFLEVYRMGVQVAPDLYARDLYKEAEVIARRVSELTRQVLGERHPDTINSMNNLAALFQAQGDYAAARPLYERALELCKQVQGERHPGTITSMNNLAMLLKAQGDFAAARPLYERALELRKEVQGELHPDTILTMNNLAQLLQAQGVYGAARPLCERALELCKQVLGERHPDSVRGMNNLAGLLQAQGDYAAARPLYERALELCKQVHGERHPNTIMSLDNLAGLLRAQGDYAAARPLCERALELFKQVLGERHPETMDTMGNLALLLQAQGDYTTARPLYERTLELCKQELGERHPGSIRGMNNLAGLLQAQGDVAAARPLYERAMELSKQVLGERHPNTITSMSNLAGLREAQGDYAGARTLYERAFELRKQTVGGRHPDTISSMNNLAALLQAIDEPQAARLLVAEALDSSFQFLNGNLPILTEREQLAFLDSTDSAFNLALSLSAGQARQDETMYQNLLAQKGLATQAAAARRRTADLPQFQPQRDQIATLRTQLNRLTYAQVTPERAEGHARQIRALTDQLGHLESELARAIGWQPQAPDGKKATAAVPDGAALVDWYRYVYFPGPKLDQPRPPAELRYVAFVVQPGQPVRRIELGPAGPIDEEVAGLRARLQLENGDIDEVASRLAHLVWKPLVPYLEGAHTVLMAPDADLCFVPWSALPDPDKPESHLLRRYAFGVIGSVRELIALKDATNVPGRNGLLAVGGVNYDAAGETPGRENKNTPVLANRSRSAAVEGADLSFGELPGTAEEARAIAALFKRSRPDPSAMTLSDSEATKPRVAAEMAGRRYLHLATHGYFAPPELRNALAPADDTVGLPGWEGMGRREVAGYYPGLLSGLVWAGASVPPRDPVTGLVDVGAGLMTAEEVSGLDLTGCELAVLSACETGLGRTAGGEGVLGLQRGFHQAGCRTVVASLWKVDDEATRALMERFYTNLWTQKLPVLEALRQAQLSVLDDPAYGAGGSPRLWAAWVLSGDTGGWLSRVKSPSGASGGAAP